MVRRSSGTSSAERGHRQYRDGGEGGTEDQDQREGRQGEAALGARGTAKKHAAKHDESEHTGLIHLVGKDAHNGCGQEAVVRVGRRRDNVARRHRLPLQREQQDPDDDPDDEGRGDEHDRGEDRTRAQDDPGPARPLAWAIGIRWPDKG